MRYQTSYSPMGSWLSSLVSGPKKILGDAVGYVVGGGNIPGTPTTRKYGYDPTAVANAEVGLLTAPQDLSSGVNPQGELILLGIGAVGLILALSHHSKRP